MLRFFGAVLTVIVLSGCSPKAVNDAADELTIYYINNKIYESVTCSDKEFDGSYYVLCSNAWNRKSGGLFKIELQDDNHYKIYSINGKAMQHTGAEIAEPLNDPKIDIAAIMEKF